MKPEKAIELNVPADLSETSYKEAVRMAEEHANSKEFFHQRPIGMNALKVSIWGVNEALKMMATQQDCYAVILPDYAIDEWSVTVQVSSLPVTVWSPGA